MRIANQQLIGYIKTEEAQGYTADQLRQALLKRGYAAAAVDEALREAGEKRLHPALKKKAEDDGKKSEETRPSVVAITMAVLFWLAALVWFGVAFWAFLNGDTLATLLGAAEFPMAESMRDLFDLSGIPGLLFSLLGIIPLAIGCMVALVGLGLWNRQAWARGAAMVLVVEFMFLIVTIPIGAPLLWLLNSKELKRECGEEE